jgi:hypothetical protein
MKNLLNNIKNEEAEKINNIKNKKKGNNENSQNISIENSQILRNVDGQEVSINVFIIFIFSYHSHCKTKE